jgi:hypothetical protein
MTFDLFSDKIRIAATVRAERPDLAPFCVKPWS